MIIIDSSQTFKWQEGLIIRSITRGACNGIIQQIEGGLLYAAVETKGGYHTENFQEWDQARDWVESKIIEISKISQNL